MLAGQNMSVSVLLDSDVDGISVKKQLVESPIARETNVIFVNDASQEPGRVMEIEDLRPPTHTLNSETEPNQENQARTGRATKALPRMCKSGSKWRQDR